MEKFIQQHEATQKKGLFSAHFSSSLLVCPVL